MRNRFQAVALAAVVLLATTAVGAQAATKAQTATKAKAAISCGKVESKKYGSGALSVNAEVSDKIDQKVEGCPHGYSWNACCNQCGYNLQKVGSLREGWTCKEAPTGVWLRGCSLSETCP